MVHQEPKKAAVDYSEETIRNKLYEEIDRLKIQDYEDQNMVQTKNDQQLYGNKLELIMRVAQGRILGRAPFCQNCKQRRLDFDFEMMKYRCNSDMLLIGSLDYCEGIFQFKEIETQEWQT